MFEKVDEYRSPRGDKESCVKLYRVPEELELTDLVRLAEHSPCAFPWVELSFFEDCRRGLERWSFAEFYDRQEQLVDVERISFPIESPAARLVVEGDITGISLWIKLRFELEGNAVPPALELSDVLGDPAVELPETGRGKPESLSALFQRVYYNSELGKEGLDGLTGWTTYKFFQLREGKEPAQALARFLQLRPDKRGILRRGRYGRSYLEDPTYILIGSRDEARDFALREAELTETCRRENIHLIGGTYRRFWDGFDRKDYWVTIEEYPGSADDAAVYGYVTLSCEDGESRSG